MVFAGMEHTHIILPMLPFFHFKMVVIGLNKTFIIINYLALIFGVINVSLILSLLYSYWKTYSEVKSGFTVGLLYFTSLILIQNIFIIIFLGVQLILPLTVVPSNEFHESSLPLFLLILSN